MVQFHLFVHLPVDIQEYIWLLFLLDKHTLLKTQIIQKVQKYGMLCKDQRSIFLKAAKLIYKNAPPHLSSTAYQLGYSRKIEPNYPSLPEFWTNIARSCTLLYPGMYLPPVSLDQRVTESAKAAIETIRKKCGYGSAFDNEVICNSHYIIIQYPLQYSIRIFSSRIYNNTNGFFTMRHIFNFIANFYWGCFGEDESSKIVELLSNDTSIQDAVEVRNNLKTLQQFKQGKDQKCLRNVLLKKYYLCDLIAQQTYHCVSYLTVRLYSLENHLK